MSEPNARSDDPSDAETTPDGPSPEERARLERRAFFSEGFRNLLKPLSHVVEARLDRFNRAMDESRRVARQSEESYSYPSYPGGDDDRLLRPPGALAEELFLDRCQRSGQCVTSCPVNAIQFLESDDPRLSGTPFIDPQIQACVVCDDLACMTVCPTGALQFVPRHLIDMGVAEVRHETCLRTDGEDCEICVEKCPIGAEAIVVDDAGVIEVKDAGCVGCGVCEMYCPTEPRSIVIKAP